ncbi:hypothetical protein J4226_01945 [Candidatus Pacearchaeota archaeon]|nr:hypothetical protein [Candidatus Pacearchaeota archaeon]
MKLEGIRTVVIDDKLEEVNELLLALNKKGIPYNYYSKLEDLPDEPKEGIRLVFLDFNLGVSSDVDVKTKESVIENFLHKIISQKNGPYILVIWAASIENNEVLKLLKERLPKSHNSLPVLIIDDFNKDEIKDDSGRIITRIEEKLILDKLVNVLFQWERFGHSSLSETLREFIGENEKKVSLDSFLNVIDGKIKRDFKKYTELELGSKDNDDKNLLRVPQMLLNDFFKEKSDSFIMKQDYGPNIALEIRNIEDREYEKSDRAKINSLFNLNFNESCEEVRPGKVYLVNKEFLDKIDFQFAFDKDNLKKEIMERYFQKTLTTDEEKDVDIIALEITPECDFSQKNWKTHKLIFGILIPDEIYNKTKFYKKDKQISMSGVSDSITKPLLVRKSRSSKNFLISFDCLFFKTIKNESISGLNSLFSLRKPFFSQIQHIFANHISRPGKIEFN